MSEKRDAYVAKMKAKLDKWNTEIDKMQTRVNEAGSEISGELRNQVRSLETKRAEVSERVEGLRRASEDVWRDLRTDVESSWTALDKATHSAIANLRRPGSSTPA